MAALVVVQARARSTRLPAKALLPVAGQPLVELVARRAGSTGLPVVVATSVEAEDDLVAAAATRAGVGVHRGPLEDTLARFVGAVSGLADDDLVVRLTADNPVPDGGLVGELLEVARAQGLGYARVGGEAGRESVAVPYGVSAEVFRAGLLRAADREAATAFEREHVTPWLRARAGDTAVVPDAVPAAWAPLRCTVDNFDDYLRAYRLFDGLSDPVGVGWRELCARLAALPGAPRRLVPAAARGDLTQSRLVLGTAQLGGPYGITNRRGRLSARQAHDVLVAAAQVGVTHVDTARAYGDSERRVGQGLAAGLAGQLRVVTKIRPLDDVPLEADPRWVATAVDGSLDASLAALRGQRPEVVLLHRFADLSRGGGAVPAALERRRAAGDLAGAARLGVSLSRPDELLALLDDPLVSYLQLPFNLLDRRWLDPEVAGAVARARAARPELTIVARSVFLQGLLAADAADVWPRLAGEDPRARVAALREAVAELGRASLADLAVAYARAAGWVDALVIGAETPEQVADQAALFDTPALTAHELAWLHEHVPAGSPALVDPSQWPR